MLRISVIVVLGPALGSAVSPSMELDGSDILSLEMLDAVFKLEADEGNLYRISFGSVCPPSARIKFLNSMFSSSEGLLAWDLLGSSTLLTVVTEFTFVILVSLPLVLPPDLGSAEDTMTVFPPFLDNSVGVNICCSSLMVGIRSPVFSAVIVCRCTRLLGAALLDTPLVKMI